MIESFSAYNAKSTPEIVNAINKTKWTNQLPIESLQWDHSNFTSSWLWISSKKKKRKICRFSQNKSVKLELKMNYVCKYYCAMCNQWWFQFNVVPMQMSPCHICRLADYPRQQVSVRFCLDMHYFALINYFQFDKILWFQYVLSSSHWTASMTELGKLKTFCLTFTNQTNKMNSTQLLTHWILFVPEHFPCSTCRKIC